MPHEQASGVPDLRLVENMLDYNSHQESVVVAQNVEEDGHSRDVGADVGVLEADRASSHGWSGRAIVEDVSRLSEVLEAHKEWVAADDSLEAAADSRANHEALDVVGDSDFSVLRQAIW